MKYQISNLELAVLIVLAGSMLWAIALCLLQEFLGLEKHGE